MTDIATGGGGTLNRRAIRCRTLLATTLIIISALLMTLAVSPQAHATTLNPGAPLAASPNDPTPPSDATMAAPFCGYFEILNVAWYRHCDSSRICIRVDQWWPLQDFDRMVGEGWTFLGSTYTIKGAWYIGLRCP